MQRSNDLIKLAVYRTLTGDASEVEAIGNAELIGRATTKPLAFVARAGPRDTPGDTPDSGVYAGDPGDKAPN